MATPVKQQQQKQLKKKWQQINKLADDLVLFTSIDPCQVNHQNQLLKFSYKKKTNKQIFKLEKSERLFGECGSVTVFLRRSGVD